MDLFYIFHIFNMIIDGIGSVFSINIFSGLSTLIFVVALVVIGIERHRISKDADRLEQMDENQKKKYMLISYINMGIPLAISFLLKIYYFYDSIFIKGNRDVVEELIILIFTAVTVITAYILSIKKPELVKKIFRKLKKFYGITPDENDY